ncbi:MAG TPA: hypothetical protein VKA19_09720 [Alphaproteobacteria bacterium]|nr:hypothetical protein [Alphaproteobacteria bacterium]
MQGIDWRRGFLRLWLIVVVVWFVVLGFLPQIFFGTETTERLHLVTHWSQTAPDRKELASLKTIQELQALKERKGYSNFFALEAVKPLPYHIEHLFTEMAPMVILPPAGLLALLFALAWALEGFRPKRR